MCTVLPSPLATLCHRLHCAPHRNLIGDHLCMYVEASNANSVFGKNVLDVEMVACNDRFQRVTTLNSRFRTIPRPDPRRPSSSSLQNISKSANQAGPRKQSRPEEKKMNPYIHFSAPHHAVSKKKQRFVELHQEHHRTRRRWQNANAVNADTDRRFRAGWRPHAPPAGRWRRPPASGGGNAARPAGVAPDGGRGPRCWSSGRGESGRGMPTVEIRVGKEI